MAIRAQRILTTLLITLLTGFGAAHSQSRTTAAERSAAWTAHVTMARRSPFAGLPWRTVGPAYQGGRIETITVQPDNPAVIYCGAGSGNLWKSLNNGQTWKPVFDNESAFAMGAVAVDPADPDVVWVGTGEVLMARSSFAGTGIFRSADGGESWQHMGLAETHHIARVLIDPNDSDIIYVAAQGHLFSDNPERGVFRSIDGGHTWKKVLYVSEKTGCVELVMHPRNPDILFAVMWQHERKAWGHRAAGPESGLYKTTDGGDTWQRVSGGLPQGDQVGRMGIAVSASDPENWYLILDNHASGPDGKGRIGGELYRSRDGGAAWHKTNQEPLPTAIGYDFCLVRISPDDPDHVWVLGNYLLESRDGGASFTRNQGEIVHLRQHDARVLHLDQHDMWIDPKDSGHILLGNDGGLYQSYDGGRTWLHLNNLPVAEVYAVTVDDADPYNIYIGTQDNAALFGPADSLSMTKRSSWRHVYLDPWGGGDSYFTRADPSDLQTIYYEHQFGYALRKDMRTGEAVQIMPRAAENEPAYRYNWMTPFILSGYDPKTLYYCTNFVHKSTNRGDDWTIISPDLTSDPGPEKQGNVPYGTITSISESPLQRGQLLIGTDDGKVQLTANDGKHWADISAGLPADKWVSRVVTSQHNINRLYVTLTGYRDNDITSYVYRSENRGTDYLDISSNLPPEPVNVIREDPRDENILYLGTDLGVYVSLDRGTSWCSLCSGLPTTPVHDLAVQERARELVAGTHGRGVFVLDITSITGETATQHHTRLRY